MRWRAGLQIALIGLLCLAASPNLQGVRAQARLAPALPTELDLIPRDAAAFISIRVADLWNSPAAKDLRAFVEKQTPNPIVGLEKEMGLKIGEIERVTLLFPSAAGIDARRPGLLVLVTTSKPFDADRLLEALQAMTPEEMRQFRDEAPGAVFPTKKAPTLEIEAPPKLPLPPEPKFPPKLAPPPKEGIQPRGVPKFEGDSGGEEQQQPERRPRRFDPDAPFYVLGSRGSALMVLINDRTFAILPDLDGDRGISAMALIGQLLGRKTDGPLSPALATANAKNEICVGVNVQAFAKLLPPELPLQLQPFRPLFAARGATLSIQVANELNLSARFEFADGAAARKGDDTLRALLTIAKEMLPGVRREVQRDKNLQGMLALIETLEGVLRDAAPQVRDNAVQLNATIKADAAWNAAIAGTIAQVQAAGRRTTAQNNLKQIGLAMHNFHDVFGMLPFPGIGKMGAPIRDATGKPLLSWRVAILPFIEQEPLFKEFKLDEPWDSEHNKKLIPKMPKLYAPLNDVKAQEGHTFYQCFSGPHAMHAGMSLVRFTDGTSNTLMIVEAGETVIWTKPQDMEYDPKKPVPKLGGLFDGDFNAVFGDGHVRFIKKSIKEEVLRAIITANGGEVANLDDER